MQTPVTDLKALFASHVSSLQKSAEEDLVELGLPGVVFAAGREMYYFEDNFGVPFKANHHFRHWCPAEGANHLLVVEQGRTPLLLAYEPVDYWHVVAKVGEGEFWLGAVEVKTFGALDDIWKYVEERCKGFVLHGPTERTPASLGMQEASKELLARLNWTRTVKTDYELVCLEGATELAARGHRAAKAAFLAGETELGIYNAYLGAMRVIERNLPYTAIVCLDANASTLHYYSKRDDRRDGKVFLIDAGGQISGYASDITRTYAAGNADGTFQSILAAMNRAQQKLCDLVRPGVTNVELNLQSHVEVAEILLGHGVVKGLSSEAAVAQGLSRDFYPHGLGHLLGLHVHDVGGHQINRQGDPSEPDPRFPNLRSTRPLVERNYHTIEPGLYFIESLLEKRRASELAHHFDWKLVEKLMPCGGIRIEDNVVVTKDGHRNLTRKYLT